VCLVTIRPRFKAIILAPAPRCKRSQRKFSDHPRYATTRSAVRVVERGEAVTPATKASTIVGFLARAPVSGDSSRCGMYLY
jgi:hypothetical protein